MSSNSVTRRLYEDVAGRDVSICVNPSCTVCLHDFADIRTIGTYLDAFLHIHCKESNVFEVCQYVQLFTSPRQLFLEVSRESLHYDHPDESIRTQVGIKRTPQDEMACRDSFHPECLTVDARSIYDSNVQNFLLTGILSLLSLNDDLTVTSLRLIGLLPNEGCVELNFGRLCPQLSCLEIESSLPISIIPMASWGFKNNITIRYMCHETYIDCDFYLEGLDEEDREQLCHSPLYRLMCSIEPRSDDVAPPPHPRIHSRISTTPMTATDSTVDSSLSTDLLTSSTTSSSASTTSSTASTTSSTTSTSLPTSSCVDTLYVEDRSWTSWRDVSRTLARLPPDIKQLFLLGNLTQPDPEIFPVTEIECDSEMSSVTERDPAMPSVTKRNPEISCASILDFLVTLASRHRESHAVAVEDESASAASINSATSFTSSLLSSVTTSFTTSALEEVVEGKSGTSSFAGKVAEQLTLSEISAISAVAARVTVNDNDDVTVNGVSITSSLSIEDGDGVDAGNGDPDRGIAGHVVTENAYRDDCDRDHDIAGDGVTVALQGEDLTVIITGDYRVGAMAETPHAPDDSHATLKCKCEVSLVSASAATTAAPDEGQSPRAAAAARSGSGSGSGPRIPASANPSRLLFFHRLEDIALFDQSTLPAADFSTSYSTTSPISIPNTTFDPIPPLLHMSVVRRLFAAIPSLRSLQFPLHKLHDEEIDEGEAAGEGEREVQAAGQEVAVVEEMHKEREVRDSNWSFLAEFEVEVLSDIVSMVISHRRR